MKHASAASLDRLEDLLCCLRGISGLSEKRPGIFYKGGRAFLHFHEDPAGLFADLRIADDWARFPVNNIEEQRLLFEKAGAVRA
jgi:hypothetical protein